jgi:hypothetical protein
LKNSGIVVEVPKGGRPPSLSQNALQELHQQLQYMGGSADRKTLLKLLQDKQSQEVDELGKPSRPMSHKTLLKYLGAFIVVKQRLISIELISWRENLDQIAPGTIRKPNKRNRSDLDAKLKAYRESVRQNFDMEMNYEHNMMDPMTGWNDS